MELLQITRVIPAQLLEEGQKQRQKQYRENNKEKIRDYLKQYNKDHKDERKQYYTQYYKDNKEEIKQLHTQYYEDNKEEIKQHQKHYRENNKDKIRQYREDNKDTLKQRQKEYRKQYYKDNKEKEQQYYENNKEYIKQRQKQHRKQNNEDIKEKAKQYRENNKEQISKQKKQYYVGNKEKIKQLHKQYREDNKERNAEYMKNYAETHRDKKNERNRRYREKKKLQREAELVNESNLNEQFIECSVDDTEQIPQTSKGLLDRLDTNHMVNAKVDQTEDMISKTEELSNTIESENPTNFVMVFDVEHSGTRESHVLQLSWGLYTKDGALVRSTDLYVKPDGYININPHVSKKIHLTYEELLSKSNSLPIKELLTLFMADASQCRVLVSHNMSADEKTMNKELERNGFEKKSVKTYCPMKETKTYCNMKDSLNRLKNPSLEELHVKLFGSNLDANKAHNSCYDFEVCAKCYFKLHPNNNDIQQGGTALGWSAQIQREYLLG